VSNPCHESSISVDTDYSNRFSNSAQRYTLYPLVWFLQSHRREIRMPNLSLSLHFLTLTIIPEGVRPPPCPNRTKHSPSLSSLSHPTLRNKARCISYMRQEDNIYNNRVYRDKYHNNIRVLLHSGSLITK
jgi:hypothetical protein